MNNSTGGRGRTSGWPAGLPVRQAGGEVRPQEGVHHGCLSELDRHLQNTFSREKAQRMKALLREFTQGVIETAKGEGKDWKEKDVLQRLFLLSAMAGGSYLNPMGEEITRIVVAGLHREETGIPFTADDVILMAGASHAMGTLFKLFALPQKGTLTPRQARGHSERRRGVSERSGSKGATQAFLKPGDTIAMTAPSYWPNRGFAQELGLAVLNVSVNIKTGEIETESLETLSHADPAPKVLFLIDPHNPTGFKFREEDLENLAEAARALDAIVVTEELYFPFFPGTSICSLCPERTIRVHARSKSELSTGLRFGEIVMTKETRETLRRKLQLRDEVELLQAIKNAKAPGFAAGQFQHTTFVPGPSQLLGIAHLILGREEREQFISTVNGNRRVFCEKLGLPYREGTYYLVFDLNDVPRRGEASPRGRGERGGRGEASGGSAEKLLTNLAEAGVIYLPAVKFFEEGTAPPTVVRASVANAGRERILEAAEITRQVLSASSNRVTE